MDPDSDSVESGSTTLVPSHILEMLQPDPKLDPKLLFRIRNTGCAGYGLFPTIQSGSTWECVVSGHMLRDGENHLDEVLCVSIARSEGIPDLVLDTLDPASQCNAANNKDHN